MQKDFPARSENDVVDTQGRQIQHQNQDAGWLKGTGPQKQGPTKPQSQEALVGHVHR